MSIVRAQFHLGVFGDTPPLSIWIRNSFEASKILDYILMPLDQENCQQLAWPSPTKQSSDSNLDKLPFQRRMTHLWPQSCLQTPPLSTGWELTQTSWGEPWNGVVLAELCNRGADSCVLSSLTLLLSRENSAQKCSDFGFLSPAGFANVIPIFMTCSAEFLLYSLLYSLKTSMLWTFLAYLKPLKFQGTGLKCQHYVFVWLLFKSPNWGEGMAQ